MHVGGAFLAAMLIAPAAAVAAEAEPICADRPGKADGTCTVLAGAVQVETAIFDWTRDSSEGARSDALGIGSTAVKLGVTDRFHVQLSIAPYSSLRVREANVREREAGFGDIALGAKYRLTGDSAPVQVAALPFVKIPTANGELGNGKVEGGIAIPIDYAIPDSPVSLTASPSLELLADSVRGGHHLAMAQAVSIGLELTARLAVAVDLWSQWDWDRAGTVRQFSIGPSAAYLLSNDVQIDTGIDLGLNRSTPDVQLSSGIAFRF